MDELLKHFAVQVFFLDQRELAVEAERLEGCDLPLLHMGRRYVVGRGVDHSEDRRLVAGRRSSGGQVRRVSDVADQVSVTVIKVGSLAIVRRPPALGPAEGHDLAG